MNVLFIGSTSLSCIALATVHEVENVNVVGCITAPKDFTISYSQTPVRNVLHRDIRPLCAELGVPVVSTATGLKDPKLLEWALSRLTETVIVVGWHHMVPTKWLQLFPTYGVHASLLPDLAGGAPLVWSLLLGREKTGLTMFRFDEGVDSGPILGQVAFPIGPEDDISDLLNKSEQLSPALIGEQVRLLRDGLATLTPQNPRNRVEMPQRSPEDGRIDWTQDSSSLLRFVRAQTHPYPGAFSPIHGHRVVFYKTAVFGESARDSHLTSLVTALLDMAKPGTFLIEADELFVKCADAVLVAHLDQIEWPAALKRPPAGTKASFDV